MEQRTVLWEEPQLFGSSDLLRIANRISGDQGSSIGWVRTSGLDLFPLPHHAPVSDDLEPADAAE